MRRRAKLCFSEGTNCRSHALREVACQSNPYAARDLFHTPLRPPTPFVLFLSLSVHPNLINPLPDQTKNQPCRPLSKSSTCLLRSTASARSPSSPVRVYALAFRDATALPAALPFVFKLMLGPWPRKRHQINHHHLQPGLVKSTRCTNARFSLVFLSLQVLPARTVPTLPSF